jgi:hypothetical protein
MSAQIVELHAVIERAYNQNVAKIELFSILLKARDYVLKTRAANTRASSSGLANVSSMC